MRPQSLVLLLGELEHETAGNPAVLRRTGSLKRLVVTRAMGPIERSGNAQGVTRITAAG